MRDIREFYSAALALVLTGCGTSVVQHDPEAAIMEGAVPQTMEDAFTEGPDGVARRILQEVGGCVGIDDSAIGRDHVPFYTTLVSSGRDAHLVYAQIHMAYDRLRDACPEQREHVDRHEIEYNILLERRGYLPHQVLVHRARDGI